MGASVREELHKLIDVADDALINEIYDLLQEGTPAGINYTTEEIDTFYNRLSEHERGASQSYTVEEAFAMIRNKKP